jgi:NAD(P)-dependent dehydrogenase (short-subunit alcohol dehydrogenase family)
MGRLELGGESGELMQTMVDNAGLRRVGTPEGIAPATEFLPGPAAAFITGTDLLVDGGVIAAFRPAQSILQRGHRELVTVLAVSQSTD